MVMPTWAHTLHEARRQALVAIDFYNRAGERRSYFDFVVHMHLAWQNLLHADRLRRGEQIFYSKGTGKARRYTKNSDGTRKTWDLCQCVRHELKDQPAMQANIEFFIGLRNQIEHRHQESIASATEAESHAYVLNFESELVRRFGTEHSLGAELRFPLFVQSLTPRAVQDQLELRRSVPAATQTYITRFQAGLSEEVKSDERFTYRILLIPVKGPKTDADTAMTFVRQEDLTDEEKNKILSGETSVIFADKYRAVLDPQAMLPAAAVQEISAAIPFVFKMHHFVALRKHWGVGPARGGDEQGLPNSKDFTIYSPAHKHFLYRPSFVERAKRALSTRTGYFEVFRRDPEPKVPAA